MGSLVRLAIIAGQEPLQSAPNAALYPPSEMHHDEHSAHTRSSYLQILLQIPESQAGTALPNRHPHGDLLLASSVAVRRRPISVYGGYIVVHHSSWQSSSSYPRGYTLYAESTLRETSTRTPNSPYRIIAVVILFQTLSISRASTGGRTTRRTSRGTQGLDTIAV